MRNSIILFIFSLAATAATAQELRPGVPGMGPTKWITIRKSVAPGGVYQSLNSGPQAYAQEDFYIKAWIPVAVKPRFAMAVGPNFRSEELELKNEESGNAMPKEWELRSFGLELKSLYQLDSSSFLINTGSISRSATADDTRRNAPLSYTFSTTYLMKKSMNKEIGFGLAVNKSDKWMVLPVFIFNYNFSPRTGLEVSLPRKISWRYNLTPRDILYLRADANARGYFIHDDVNDKYERFRRIDVDMGVAYNKQLNNLMGFELFAGYRENISTRTPASITAIQNSGWFASFEVFIRPPQGVLKRK